MGLYQSSGNNNGRHMVKSQRHSSAVFLWFYDEMSVQEA